MIFITTSNTNLSSLTKKQRMLMSPQKKHRAPTEKQPSSITLWGGEGCLDVPKAAVKCSKPTEMKNMD